MASLAEKLASNITFDDFKKATDLKKRIWFTLCLLIIYRLGSYIPLPGVNASIVQSFFEGSGGFLGMFDMFTGGNLSRMTIFALNIMPYISASIIISLMATASPELKELKKEGESGHEKINQYTRYLTILICCVQGWGISAWLENMTGPSGAAAVADPGFFFRFSTVVSLLGGTMLVMWMGEQITSRGIGNGSSLIIFAGIVANLPGAVFQTIELGKVGQLQPLVIAMILGVLVAATLFVVFMEQAQRRVLIHYPKQNMGAMANTTHLPLKINTAGVIPPIFAGAILQIPAAFIMFGASSESSLVMFFNRWLSDGSPVYYFVYSSLIVFFAFFYTALQFNSEETAENLKSYGAFISGVRPGAATAEYFDRVLTRITVLGSAYLVVLCMLPSFLINQFGVPFYLGGTTLLIVCNVVTETVAQIQANLISGQYQGIIKNAKSAGKPRFAR